MKLESWQNKGFLKTARKWLIVIWVVWLAGSVIVSGLSFGGAVAPVWVLFVWAVFFVIVSAFAQGKAHIVSVNIAIIFFILMAFELFFLYREYRKQAKAVPERLENVYDFIRDDAVGGRMVPGKTRHAKKYVGDQLIYDVVITSDSNGLRISPPCNTDNQEAVLFFGDSFTFGEGVNDDETIPWLVGEALQEHYCIYNFALHGYGPHQMLSLVESGRVEGIVKKDVKQIIYQALYPDHVFRLMGYFDWDLYGPWYILGENGIPLRAGNFDDAMRTSVWENFLERSAFGKKFLNFFRYRNKNARDFFVIVMLHTRELLLQLYPDAEFHMIIWDWTEGRDARNFERLEDAGIILHDVTHILPNGDKSNLAYKISPYDRHPNQACHRIFADYILENIFGEKPPSYDEWL